MKKWIALVMMMGMLSSLTGCSNWGKGFDVSWLNDLGGNQEVCIQKPTLEDYIIPETKIIDNAHFQVTIKKNEHSSIKVLYENYSELKVKCRTEVINVNGYDLNADWPEHFKETSWCSDLPAYDKLERTLFDNFDEDKLLNIGIRAIESLQIKCVIMDRAGELLYDEVYTLNFGTTEQSDNGFCRSLQNGEYSALTGRSVKYVMTDITFEQDGIRIPTVALVEDRIQGHILCVEFENLLDKYHSLGATNVAINGLSIAAYEYCNVSPLSRFVCEINIEIDEWIQSVFDFKDITSVLFTIRDGNLSQENWHKITCDISDMKEIDVSGKTIYNDHDLLIVHKGIYKNKRTGLSIDSYYNQHESTYYTYEMILYIENNNKHDVSVVVDRDRFYLNNIKLDASNGYEFINAHSSGYMVIQLNNEEMNSNGLSDVDEIEEIELKLTLRANSYDLYDGYIEFNVE